jgi:hypothetical protein
MEFVARYLPWRRTYSPLVNASLKLELIVISRRELDIAMHRCQVTGRDARGAAPPVSTRCQFRAAVAANSSTAAAALTLSDSIRPCSGTLTSASHEPATRGRSPRPSDPRTSATVPA